MLGYLVMLGYMVMLGYLQNLTTPNEDLFDEIILEK